MGNGPSEKLLLNIIINLQFYIYIYVNDVNTSFTGLKLLNR